MTLIHGNATVEVEDNGDALNVFGLAATGHEGELLGLLRMLRKEANGRQVYFYVTPDADDKVRDFYERVGAEKIMDVYRWQDGIQE